MSELTTAVPAPASAEESFETFLRLSVADGAASPRTLKNYRAGFALFLGWCNSVCVDPRTATYHDLTKYRVSLVDAGYKPGTIGLQLCAMRTLYTALHRWGVRPDNPASGLRAPSNRESGPSAVLRMALSPEQALAFLKALPSTWAPQDIRDATMCRLMLYHGLRVGEIAALTSESLDYNTFTTLDIIGKGAKRRTVVLCASTRKDLMAWAGAANHPARASSGPLPFFIRFDVTGFNKLSTRSIELVVDKYLKKAGLKVPGRSAHSLRHTYGVLAKMGKAEDIALAQSMGHADLKTTYHYTAAAGQYQSNPAEAVERALAPKSTEPI